MKSLIPLIAMLISQQVFALPPCRDGELLLKDNVIQLCHVTGRQWTIDAPVPQEWLGFHEAAKDDKAYADALLATVGMHPDDFRKFVEGRVASDKSFKLQLEPGADTVPAQSLIAAVNAKTGVTASNTEAEVQTAAEDKFLQLQQAADKLRLGTEFNVEDLPKIAEGNFKIMNAFKTGGCQAALDASKLGEPFRALDFTFDDGKTERLMVVSAVKTATGYRIQFYGFPPRWDPPTELHARDITVQPGSAPQWSRPAMIFQGKPQAATMFSFDPKLIPQSADLGGGAASGLCQLGQNISSTWEKVTVGDGEETPAAQ